MMRILGIVGVQVCICVPIIVFQFCKGKEFFSKEYWGYALRIGIPIVPHYLSGIILNQGDRIMIDKMVGRKLRCTGWRTALVCWCSFSSAV